MCKHFLFERFCRFEHKCDYSNVIKDNLKEAFEEVLEDLKNIKVELDLLKRTVKFENYKKKKKIISKGNSNYKRKNPPTKAEKQRNCSENK